MVVGAKQTTQPMFLQKFVHCVEKLQYMTLSKIILFNMIPEEVKLALIKYNAKAKSSCFTSKFLNPNARLENLNLLKPSHCMNI